MFYQSRSEEGPALVPRAAERGEGGLLDPVELFSSLWRRRWLVVLAGVSGAALAVALALATPKQYTATSRIVLDPRDLNLVQNEVTVTPTGLSTDATLALVESQIAVMTSDRVLARVVDEATLAADPEFNGTRTGLLASLVAPLALLGGTDADALVRDRQLVTLAQLHRHVSAVRNPNSFVIDLSVRSEDPEKAARLANLVTETFVAEQGRAQAEIARRATQALSSRLAELRQRVVDTEEAAESYKAENRLVGVGGRLIDDEYITRINNQLADVRAQITALNVRAESLRRAGVEDVVAGSFPEGLNSEALLRLRQTYNEAAQNEALLASRLGPRHPQRITSEGALGTARRAIETELTRIVASAQTELARAQATERDLTTQIDALRSRQIETSGSFVRLRELEREVDASRAVYEAYLLRARQTSEQESLNSANVRVISDATVPLDPSSLSRKVVVVAGAIAGLGLGAALVLLSTIVALLRARAGAGMRAEAPAAAPAAVQAREILDRDRRDLPEPHAAVAPALFGDDWALRGTDADAHAVRLEPDAPVSAPSLDAAGELDDVADDRTPDDRASEPVVFTAAAAESAGSHLPVVADEGDEAALARRREALRARIRAVDALRRTSGHARGPDAGEETPLPERVSLRLAALQRRRTAVSDR